MLACSKSGSAAANEAAPKHDAEGGDATRTVA